LFEQGMNTLIGKALKYVFHVLERSNIMSFKISTSWWRFSM